MKGRDNRDKKIINKFKLDLNKWKTKSKPYIEDKKKAKELLDKAVYKANHKKHNGLGEIWDNVQGVFSLVKDWINGTYRDVSKGTMALVILGILYFVTPMDIIPDFLLMGGLIDDAAILGYIIKQVGDELRKYLEWKDKDQYL